MGFLFQKRRNASLFFWNLLKNTAKNIKSISGFASKSSVVLLVLNQILEVKKMAKKPPRPTPPRVDRPIRSQNVLFPDMNTSENNNNTNNKPSPFSISSIIFRFGYFVKSIFKFRRTASNL